MPSLILTRIIITAFLAIYIYINKNKVEGHFNVRKCIANIKIKYCNAVYEIQGDQGYGLRMP